jgi:predicted nucleic acid-binding protein
MARYVLDTQHFIDVLKDRPAAAEVLTFLRTFVALVDFHAVVGAELLMGAHTRGEPSRSESGSSTRSSRSA